MDLLSWMMAGVRVVGWTLIHFLWQGTLVGIAYRLVRRTLPRGEVRYRFGMATLLAMMVCPLVTGWWMLRPASRENEGASPFALLARVVHGVTADATAPHQLVLDQWLPWLVLAWSIGVLLLSIRAWRQWRRVDAVAWAAQELPIWQAVATTLAKRFGLRRQVRVLFSPLIAAPVLIGWIRPAIILPVAVMCNFPAAQIELIFAHELAHLRHWDPLANLFQVGLETLHFYHPAVHWVSRDVRNEREICCDIMALSVSGGSRYEFAVALAELGDMNDRHGALVLGANGGVLLDRVQQMVLPRPEPAYGAMSARLVGALLGTVSLAIALQVGWSQAHLQRNLTHSLEQLTAVLSPRWLAPVFAIEIPPWPDLAPKHVRVMRPVPIEYSADTSAKVEVYSRNAVVSPSLSPATLHIENMPVVEEEVHVPVAGESRFTAASIAALMPIQMRQPIYPEVALIHGTEGKVVVEFAVAADGSVRDLSVISAKPAGVFDQAALQAIRGWRYSVNSEMPTQRRYRQELAFTLNKLDSDSARTNSAQRIEARTNCQISTGTHICRWPDSSN